MLDPATISVIISIISGLAAAASSVGNVAKTVVETLEKQRGNGWKPNAESVKALAEISSMIGRSFPLFDGRNYKIWSMMVKNLLIAYDLWDLVEKGYEEKGHNDKASKEDREKDSLIFVIILLAVDESVARCVVNAKNSKEAWEAIETQYEGGGGSMHQSAHRKAPPIEHILPCSLEDLFKGTTKKMKISREIIDASGKTMPVEEILSMNIKPGWKKGTKITFPEKGSEHPGVIPADIVFIIDEKPHELFTRDGNDLVATQNITLVDALTGYTVHLTTLDGKNLTIPINTIIHPDYEEVVPMEGMPNPKDPSKKGNLRIKFDIEFPTIRLTASQKAGIKELLGPSIC